MTRTFQEQHPTSTARTSGTPPTACARPINPHARAYAARRGDPATWKPEHFRTYRELGGAS